MRVSVVPAYAIDTSLIDRAGVDAALVKGIGLVRRTRLAPFSRQRFSISRTELLEETLKRGKHVSNHRVSLAHLRRFFFEHSGEPLIVRWDSAVTASLAALLRTPPTAIIAIRSE